MLLIIHADEKEKEESEIEEDVSDEMEEIDDERFSDFMDSFSEIRTDRVAPVLNQVAVADETPVRLERNIAQTPRDEDKEQITYNARTGTDYQTIISNESSDSRNYAPPPILNPRRETTEIELPRQEFLDPMQEMGIHARTGMEPKLIDTEHHIKDTRKNFEKERDEKYQEAKLNKKWV